MTDTQRIKVILYRPLARLYHTVCSVLPRNPRKIILISQPDFSDNTFHLFRYLDQASDFDFVWLTIEAPDLSALRKKYKFKNKVSVVRKNSLRGFLHFCTANVVFHSHGVYFFVTAGRGPLIINLWHGMPLKRTGYLDDNRRVVPMSHSDYVLSTSDFYSSVLRKTFYLPEEPGEVLNIGLPRNDVLLSPVKTEVQIREQLKFIGKNKIIVWLPTYRKSSYGEIREDSLTDSFLEELPKEFLEELNSHSEKQGVSILIKIHPMDRLNTLDTIPKYSNVHILRTAEWESLGVDLYDVLAVSLALVSDISSVIIDYFLTGRPIAMLQSGIANYTRGINSTVDMDALLKNVTLISGVEDMTSFISKASGAEARHSVEPVRGNVFCAVHSKPSCEALYDLLVEKGMGPGVNRDT